MRKVTMTEANQNFSKVARFAAENETVIIEKNGEDKYVVLSIDEYRKIMGESFWVDVDEKTIAKFEVFAEDVTMYEIEHLKGDTYRYTKCEIPSSVVDMNICNDDIVMNFNKKMLDAITTRESLNLYRTVELDISDDSISAIAKDKAKRDELRDILELKELLKEGEEARQLPPKTEGDILINAI